MSSPPLESSAEIPLATFVNTREFASECLSFLRVWHSHLEIELNCYLWLVQFKILVSQEISRRYLGERTDLNISPAALRKETRSSAQNFGQISSHPVSGSMLRGIVRPSCPSDQSGKNGRHSSLFHPLFFYFLLSSFFLLNLFSLNFIYTLK